jgi:nucleoid-associated protein YgaU
MNKSKLLVLFILVVSAALVFAQAETETFAEMQEADETEVAVETQEADETEVQIPFSILNNPYYLESVRLTEKAKEAYEIGDYDASTAYAEQAAEYARRSDEYVSRRLAEDVLLKAHSRYTWAGSAGAETQYPEAYKTASAAYTEAQEANEAQDWDSVIDAANRVLAALSVMPGGTPGRLPAMYTVRDWRSTGDCLWNIAGHPAVYGDPYQWRKLYEANKEKLPDSKNPNWVEPGTVLTIPSLKGETRSGMWNPSVKY